MIQERENTKYPAAELLVQHCYEDYKNELDNYNRIYDKVNIALTFCGVILLVFIDHVDLSLIGELFQKPPIIKAIMIIGNLIASLVCTYQIFSATIKLVGMMEGKRIKVFNSVEFRNERRYLWEPNEAALALITAYTNCTFKLRKIVSKKQSDYDIAVRQMAHAIFFYAVSAVLQKIGGIV